MSNELSNPASSTSTHQTRQRAVGRGFGLPVSWRGVLEYTDFRNFITVVNKARQGLRQQRSHGDRPFR